MFGNNPKRAPDYGDGLSLDIVSIFTTIQGEGTRAGTPAIFIRLGGCNLTCKFCDTEFEDFSRLQLQDIINKITELRSAEPLIVITGGEPFRQNIAPLCEELINSGYIVQIETNGTLYVDIHKDVEIICCPKKGTNGYPRVKEELLKRITAFKFLISADIKKYSTVPNLGQAEYNIPVYLQPIDAMDSKVNDINTKLAIKFATQYGYNLSIQLHKILGLE